jgi:NADH-quinone oxidoreductase subunit G
MSDDIVKIEINGKPVQARKGQMIIQAADEVGGLYIPRFCYHKKLSIAANCRMCLVEVEKAPKPVPACATPVMEGMKVYTKSDLAMDAQKGVMEFLLINHPLDCPICDQGGECELQDLAMGYGTGVSRYTEKKRVVADENIGPLVSTDMTRCIHCTRCVRFGEEVAGVRELGATGRSENMRIGTYVKKAVSSELSGNIIDLCPVGALNNKPYRYSARAWELIQHPAVGAHDCVGSNMYLHSTHGTVKRAVPRENESINETWLADRDRYSCEALYGPNRFTAPAVKRGGKWQTIGWDEALLEVASRLADTTKQYGADSMAALVSPATTVEEGYLLQKWLRGAGCGNIDHRSWQHDFRGDTREPVMPWLGTDIAQLEHMNAALLIASNIRKDQPMLSHRLRKAAAKGATISFINGRRYDLNFSALQQAVHPDEIVTALAAVAKALSVNGAAINPALKKHFDTAAPGKEAVAIARSLAEGEKKAVIIGSQAFLNPRYSDIYTLAREIARAANAKFGCLPLGANSAGLWLAGAVPHRQAGGKPADKAGLNARQLIEQHKRLYLLYGVEPECDSWDAQATGAALGAAQHVIAFSAFDSPALREHAHLILPLAAFAETDGTYVNIEGRWQSWRRAGKAPGDAREGWRILRMLGGFEYFSADEIRNEIAQLCENIQLENSTPAAAELGLPGSIPVSGNRLLRVSEIPIYATDAVVRRSPPLQETEDAKLGRNAVVHPETAKLLKLSENSRVEIRQNGVSAHFPLRIDDSIAPGCVLTPLGVSGATLLGAAYSIVELEQQ